MIDQDALKHHGYTGPYPSHKGEGCLGLWQKIVYTPDRMRAYYINIYLWDFSVFGHTSTPEGARKSASANVRFYATDDSVSAPGETDFDLDLLVGKTTTIPQIESFYAKAYKALGCVPDRHNNDSAPYHVDEPGSRFERVEGVPAP